MNSALPLLLFFGFLFASTFLVLVMGVLSREEEKKAEQAARAAAKGDGFDMPPHFLSRPSRAVPRAEVPPVDDSLVRRVERFLCMEDELAGDFVSAPSIETLHGASARERRFGALLIDLVERYLSEEQRLVSRFVSDPSVESLYGGNGRACAASSWTLLRGGQAERPEAARAAEARP